MCASPSHPPPDLAARLRQLRDRHLYRRRRVLDSPQGAEIEVDGERLLAFCSNDYLGLANHPDIVAAFQRGAGRYGVGAGASHLVSGHSAAHHALEEELADFVGSPRALLFSTGYMANLGVVGALLDRHAVLFEDKLNHASLIDAARLSQATVKRYAHADVVRLARLFEAHAGDAMIVTDGVFSMDGDLAPLPELTALARRRGSWLLVDDAHGLGVVGARGRGSFEHYGIARGPADLLVGTLGKAFGSFGAFVAGSEEVIETLIQDARTYIYTTALPPAVAEATRAALKLVQTEDWRRDALRTLIERFRRGAAGLGLRLGSSATPIQPILLGEARAALAASESLRRDGILVTAIRPPTVPAGGARLRVTLSAAHREEHVDRLLDALARIPGAG
ncbi:MAG TPA: 8-amino-7-oxononanoate synthase [Acidiferrobacterales bacterium]